METYIKRITSVVRPWQIAFWWMIRITIFAAIFIPPVPATEMTHTQSVLQMCANFATTFLWEIFMLFPEKTFIRQLPPAVQNISAPFILLTSFCGAYLGFYYSIWCWDAALHVLGSFFGVNLCYEVLCAIQKRDRRAMNVTVLIVASVGLCFLFGVIWEIFEFSFDQIVPGGDTQHWDVLRFHEGYRNIFMPTHMTAPDAELMKAIAELGPAEKAALTVSDLKYFLRMSLMDTMSDTVCNAAGGIAGFVLLKLLPYRHRGENNLNLLFANNKTKLH